MMDLKKINLSLGEIFFLQLIGWTGLWLLNDFVAVLLTLCIGAVVFVVLVIALLSEIFERSRVPRRYFWIMALSLLAIIAAAAVYVFLLGGRFDFLS